MHKVETAGHAGTASGLPRLPVLKLLTAKSCISGARGLRLGVGPESREAVGRGLPGTEAEGEMRRGSLGSGAKREERAKN